MKFHLQAPSNALERTIYRTFLLFSGFMILASLLISLAYDIHRQRRYMDRVIYGSAAYVAGLPGVVSMLEAGYPDSATLSVLEDFCENIPDINGAVVYNTSGLRFFHTSRHATGESYLDGSEKPVLAGADPYITTGYDTTGAQRRAYHAVRSSSGEIIGFVMLSIPQAVISASDKGLILLHFAIFLVMMAVCLAATQATLRYIRSALAGHDPDELLNLYTRQNSVLNNLAEGIAATDRNGKIIFANSEARAILASGSVIREHRIGDIFPDSAFARVIRDGEPVLHRNTVIGGRSLLISEVPIMPGGSRSLLRVGQGAGPDGELVILQDRTETLKLSDELSGARSMMDTMRAFNHEYLNKLHVILGYLQIGEIEKAKKFITNAGLVSSQAVRQTANSIRESRICALVIGKMMHAAELGITLSVTPDSLVLENDLLIPLDSLVTIIGNLLENAIDELDSADVPVKEVVLSLYFSPEVNILVCTDTGRGIDPAIRDHIFDMGISTKGAGHGTGLYLIRQITRNYGGTIDLESEPGEGTSFTVTFTGEKGMGAGEDSTGKKGQPETALPEETDQNMGGNGHG